MTTFLALIQTDLQLFFQNRRAVIMSFLAPILIGSFFGFVLGGPATGKQQGQTKLLVVDQENGAVSRDLIQKLQAEKLLAVQLTTLEQARQLVQKGKAPVAVVIPPNFGQDATQAFFSRQKKPAIILFTDPSHQIESSMIKGLLTGHVMQAVSKEAFGGTLGRMSAADGLKQIEASPDMSTEDRSALKQILEGVVKYNPKTADPASDNPVAGGLSIPFETTEELLTASKGVPYNPYAHSFGGMAIQFILFMGIDVGIGMLTQRQRGLWKRFRAAPVAKVTLLGARAISATFIAVLILVVVFTFARLAFGVRIEGSYAGFLAVSTAFGLFTAAYGLLIAALGKNPEAARGLSILATLLMVMLSGAWVPSFLFPPWLQKFTTVIPARWAMDGLDAMIWRGRPFAESLLPTAILLGFAILFGAIATQRFRWEID